MTINIADEGALDALTSIEGEQWRSEQHELDGYTFHSFRERYRELLATDPELLELLSDAAISVNDNKAIYGSGGRNRYFVRGDGRIVFSKIHARGPEDIQKAEELGFEIQ